MIMALLLLIAAVLLFGREAVLGLIGICLFLGFWGIVILLVIAAFSW
jgi:hypothetical protein